MIANYLCREMASVPLPSQVTVTFTYRMLHKDGMGSKLYLSAGELGVEVLPKKLL